MSLVTSWSDLVREAAAKFPCVDPGFLQAREGDMGALTWHIAQAHALTFAEAAEMVTFRLPFYLEPARLSA